MRYVRSLLKSMATDVLYVKLPGILLRMLLMLITIIVLLGYAVFFVIDVISSLLEDTA